MRMKLKGECGERGQRGQSVKLRLELLCVNVHGHSQWQSEATRHGTARPLIWIERGWGGGLDLTSLAKPASRSHD